MTYDKKDKMDFPTEEQLLRIINEFIPFFFNVTVVILSNYSEILSIRITDVYTDSINNYGGIYLTDIINQEDALTNKTAYTNEGEFENFRKKVKLSISG